MRNKKNIEISTVSFKSFRTLLLSVFCFLTIDACLAQECVRLDDIGTHVLKNLRPIHETLDSVNLTIFVRFKIDTAGQINSIWVNRPKIKVNYDKYISETDAASLKLYYSIHKKLYVVEEKIFQILEDKELKVCKNIPEDFSFLLPVLIDFRSDKSTYNFENNLYALKGIFEGNYSCYYFLPPLEIQRPFKNRGPR